MRRFAVLGLAIAATACDAWVTKPVRYNTVVATVHQRNGTPVSGVPLVLYTGDRPMGYGKTDPAGEYVFERVPQGLYGVQLIADSSFVPIENVIRGPVSTVLAGFDLTHDSTVHATFTVLRRGPGSVEVRVVGDSGAPLGGVDVEIFDPRRVAARGTTGTNGIALFQDIPFGLYGVRITHPPRFRDFVVLNDSLYTVRDGIVVDEGSTESLRFPLTKCAGTINVRVSDQNDAPVPLVTAALFGAGVGQVQRSSSAGIITFTDVPCVQELGVQINPPEGYSVAVGRGFNVIDGIKVTNRSVASISFRVQKL